MSRTSQELHASFERLCEAYGTMSKLDMIKFWLKEQNYREDRQDRKVSVLPIVHNKEHIELLMSGWSITIHSDGTWHWDADTSGG